jgi:hypothetical protein
VSVLTATNEDLQIQKNKLEAEVANLVSVKKERDLAQAMLSGAYARGQTDNLEEKKSLNTELRRAKEATESIILKNENLSKQLAEVQPFILCTIVLTLEIFSCRPTGKAEHKSCPRQR